MHILEVTTLTEDVILLAVWYVVSVEEPIRGYKELTTIIIILKISQFLHILEAITLTEGVLLIVVWYVVSVEEPIRCYRE